MEYTLQNSNSNSSKFAPHDRRDTSSKMSILAMSTPSPHASFKREYYSWDDSRQADYASSRPRSDPERVTLPPIRQAFPDLHLRVVPTESVVRTPSSTTSPVVGPSGTLTPPEYVHSPSQNKRRRLSIDEEPEERASRVPRLYSGPASSFHQRRESRAMSPASLSAGGPRSSGLESWSSSSRTSPFMSGSASSSTTVRSPIAMEPSERPTLPSLPLLNFERVPPPPSQPQHHHQHQHQHQHPHQHPHQQPPPMQPHPHPHHHVRALSGDDYVMEQNRGLMVHPNAPGMDAAGYRQGGVGYAGYGYHHPTRVQSLSMSAIHHPMDRSPFSAGGYGPYQDYMRMGELGAMGLNGDNKQRKRRGNLPKETTDKLRAWFVAHLTHPYPTEDEKQELMRQTGLQMNQISNWFINARRRQLPTMISNARVESDAIASGRVSADGKVLPSTERSDYDVVDVKGASPLSDDGALAAYEEDLEMKHRRALNIKRNGSV